MEHQEDSHDTSGTEKSLVRKGKSPLPSREEHLKKLVGKEESLKETLEEKCRVTGAPASYIKDS